MEVIEFEWVKITVEDLIDFINNETQKILLYKFMTGLQKWKLLRELYNNKILKNLLIN